MGEIRAAAAAVGVAEATAAVQRELDSSCNCRRRRESERTGFQRQGGDTSEWKCDTFIIAVNTVLDPQKPHGDCVPVAC